MTWEERVFSRDWTELRGPPGWLLRWVQLLYLAGWKFSRNFCFERAAALAFVSLLSLVPLAVLFFSFVGVLGGGDRIIQFVTERVYQFVAPEFVDELSKWLNNTISKEAFREGPTGLVNLAAILGLILAAIAVMNTTERVFNRIWEVSGSRKYLHRVAAFWVVLTTSPFLIVASIWVRDLLVPAGGVVASFTNQSWVLDLVYVFVVPITIAFLAFTLMYLFLPATRVRLFSAATGGLVAAVLWELSKRAFYLYVLRVGTVTEFYKQLAKVPLFLVWLYVCWVIVLLGCQIASAHQNRVPWVRGRRRAILSPRFSKAYLGAYLMARLATAFSRGEPLPRTDRIATDLGESPERVDEVATVLVGWGLLASTPEVPGQLAFTAHPRTVALSELVARLHDEEFPSERSVGTPPPAATDDDAVRQAVDELFAVVRQGAGTSVGSQTLESLAEPLARSGTGSPK